MMPDATYGIGAFAGADYGRQQDRQEADMNSARTLANLAAEMEQQKATEYKQNAPVREAESKLKLLQTQSSLESLPEVLKMQGEERKAKTSKYRKEQADAINSTVDKYLSEWMQAPSMAAKQDVLKAMKGDGVTRIGAVPIDQVDMGKLDELMQRRYKAAPDTKEHRQKMQLSKEATSRTQIAADAGIRRAEIQRDARIKAEQIKSLDKATQKKWEDQMLQKISNGTATDLEKETYSMHIQNKQAVAAAREANRGPTLDPSVLPPGMFNSPTVPGPAAIPTPKEKPKYDPKKGTFGGKPVKAEAEGPKGKVYLLEDGTMLDEQGNKVDKHGDPIK